MASDNISSSQIQWSFHEEENREAHFSSTMMEPVRDRRRFCQTSSNSSSFLSSFPSVRRQGQWARRPLRLNTCCRGPDVVHNSEYIMSLISSGILPKKGETSWRHVVAWKSGFGSISTVGGIILAVFFCLAWIFVRERCTSNEAIYVYASEKACATYTQGAEPAAWRRKRPQILAIAATRASNAQAQLPHACPTH